MQPPLASSLQPRLCRGAWPLLVRWLPPLDGGEATVDGAHRVGENVDGHRVATCPKREAHRMQQIMGGSRDDLAGNASRGFGGAGTDW